MMGNILELGVRPSTVLYYNPLYELDIAFPSPDPPCSWNCYYTVTCIGVDLCAVEGRASVAILLKLRDALDLL